MERDHTDKAMSNRKKKDTYIVQSDHIQVILTDEANVKHYDYDANYIDGYDKSRKYIAAKGPSKETEVNEFWEMIYQANVSLIIMLHEIETNDKTQILQYWAAEGKSMYGNITVKTTKFTTDTDFIIRQFVVTKKNNQGKEVTQIKYTGSIADNIPCNLTSFIHFWRKSVSLVEHNTGPVLVHGSNGNGKTGLYIALDILYAQAIAEVSVNPHGITSQICSQRRNIIQTKEQYGFLYEALAEALYIRVRPMKVKEFQSFFTALRAQDPITGQSGMAFQYETLFASDPEYSELQQRQREHEYSSLSQMNRQSSHGEAPAVSDRSTAQPMLIYLQNYANHNAFILTSVDDKKKIDGLWKMIDNRKVKTIICLDTKSINYSDIDSSPDDKMYSVHSMESKKENGYIVNTYAYKRKNVIEAEVNSVRSFHFLEWGCKDTLSDNVNTVRAFASAVQKCQPEFTEDHPVLLTCRSNLNKLGIFYVLLNEFERIRRTGEVNIIETVLRLKEGNRNLTPSFEGYQFCHSAILDLINDHDTYENV